MWSTIENLKANLNKIALDVHNENDDDDLPIYGSVGANGTDGDAAVVDRRKSHSFARSSPVSRSPVANGIDNVHNSEIEQYKTQIRRLQESEKEIKALSVNYAALLKEKEEQISRLNIENDSLKWNLDATSRSESLRESMNGRNAQKGGEQSPNRQQKGKNRLPGYQTQNGLASRQSAVANGALYTVQSDGKEEYEESTFSGKEKELADLLEDNRSNSEAVQISLEMKELRIEMEKEREKLANMQLRLQEEQKLKETYILELKTLGAEKSATSIEMSNMRRELNERISEIKRLQLELSRREDENDDASMESMKRVIADLEKEKAILKMEKNELEAALDMSRKSVTQNTPSVSPDKCLDSSSGKEEVEQSLRKLGEDLKEARQQRDKALQELNRLKQHLLEKESEESEKMDEDGKMIEELRQNNEYQRAQISHLEKALKQAIANQDEIKMMNNSEIQKLKENIDVLNKKLENCMSTIDSKNVELLNLQTALGQYYAEIEAKEHLEGDFARAREETAKLSYQLKDADQREEILKREKEQILEKLSLAERTLGEWKIRVNKLEEDNSKLHRALEQSMTRLNRMSTDSDYLVDRRIVIKLLVTYFQRNHSKEVLDLMVRMLGFSDEDKQRIGTAQQGPGKGVVRGVLGLPGRLVGGILGGSPGESPANAASENQSFADLWVDFLLKETEERERREAQVEGRNASPQVADRRISVSTGSSGFSRTNFSPVGPSSGQLPLHDNYRGPEHSDSEFSTVPLTASDNSQSWRQQPFRKY